jgi:hypothetical protein
MDSMQVEVMQTSLVLASKVFQIGLKQPASDYQVIGYSDRRHFLDE